MGTKQVVCCFCRASWAKLSSSSFNLFTLLLLASGTAAIPSLPAACPKDSCQQGIHYQPALTHRVLFPRMLHLPQQSNIQLKSEIFWPILQLWHDKTIFHIVWKSLNNVAFWRDFTILLLSERFLKVYRQGNQNKESSMMKSDDLYSIVIFHETNAS